MSPGLRCRILVRMKTLLSFVKFEHTVFSIPVLLAGAFLGADGRPGWTPLLWILVAGTGARTLAMALNRILDRDLDARNPRTADRDLPAGKMSLGAAWGVAAAGLALFAWALLNLPPICLKLAPIPLAIFAIYPLMKRFTPLAHFGVGAALGFGPIGGFAAVTGTVQPFEAVGLLAFFTLTWVAGFDIIYATLDEEFDRKEGLHSLPSALGSGRALIVAALVHLAGFGSLAALTYRHLSSPMAWALFALVGALLTLEHLQVRRVNFAFFQVNAVLGFAVFALVWAGT